MNSNQLPSVVITRGVGKATDVVVGLLSTQGELALVGVPTDLAKADRNAFGRPGGARARHLRDDGDVR